MGEPLPRIQGADPPPLELAPRWPRRLRPPGGIFEPVKKMENDDVRQVFCLNVLEIYVRSSKF